VEFIARFRRGQAIVSVSKLWCTTSQRTITTARGL
jgi:hypothetical protein